MVEAEFPDTVSFDAGAVVPMPKLPFAVRRIFSVRGSACIHCFECDMRAHRAGGKVLGRLEKDAARIRSGERAVAMITGGSDLTDLVVQLDRGGGCDRPS